jgi:transcriptional regulator with XRE-family HTH domain
MKKYPNIKAFRLQNNYKQEYVADVLGVSQPEYSKIENGSRRIDAFMISELCKLYDVKMDELLKREAPRLMNAIAADSEAISVGYGSVVNSELFSKLMDNYTVLVENYLKQQQTTERIINRLFENSSLEGHVVGQGK